MHETLMPFDHILENRMAILPDSGTVYVQHHIVVRLKSFIYGSFELILACILRVQIDFINFIYCPCLLINKISVSLDRIINVKHQLKLEACIEIVFNSNSEVAVLLRCEVEV